MIKLCDQLDKVEGDNFDLVVQVNESSLLKTETIPKLLGDVKEARYLKCGIMLSNLVNQV